MLKIDFEPLDTLFVFVCLFVCLFVYLITRVFVSFIWSSRLCLIQNWNYSIICKQLVPYVMESERESDDSR